MSLVLCNITCLWHIAWYLPRQEWSFFIVFMFQLSEAGACINAISCDRMFIFYRPTDFFIAFHVWCLVFEICTHLFTRLQGLYAMAMNCMDNAISQFQTALSCCTDTHFWTFINLNLGIINARLNRHSEFMALLLHIHPHQVPQE